MRYTYFVWLVIIITLIGCTEKLELPQTLPEIKKPSMQQPSEAPAKKPVSGKILVTDISLTTDDNITLVGTYYKGSTDKAVILLHMLNKERSTWSDFAVALQNGGYNVIAIDFRGHGESDLNLQSFDDTDFNKMVLDVEAAKGSLEEKGLNNIAIVGASIGANVAVKYAVNDIDVKTLILVSPGTKYRGVRIDETIKEFDKPILITAGEYDGYASESSQKLAMIAPNAVLQIYKNSQHGTNLFWETDLSDQIIEWLKINLR